MRQVSRSGWFVFLYLLIMALFMSLGTTFIFLGTNNQILDEATTGCRVADSDVVCDGANYNPDALFYIYNIRVYFLDSSMSVDTINNMSSTSIVVHNDTITLYVGNLSMGSEKIFSDPQYQVTTLAEGMDLFSRMILIGGIAANYLDNLILITLFALISSVMFLRYRAFIRYKKLFKLAVFGVTPFAILITLFNIFNLNQGWFFLVVLLAYLPLIRLNREIFGQVVLRQMSEQEKDDSVVDSIRYEDIPSEDVDDDEDNDDQN